MSTGKCTLICIGCTYSSWVIRGQAGLGRFLVLKGRFNQNIMKHVSPYFGWSIQIHHETTTTQISENTPNRDVRVTVIYWDIGFLFKLLCKFRILKFYKKLKINSLWFMKHKVSHLFTKWNIFNKKWFM